MHHLVLVAAAQPIEVVARHLHPDGRIDVAGMQVRQRPLLAELAHLLVKEGILGQQPVEIVLGDGDQVGVGFGAHGGGARAAAQQRHLAERLAVAQLGQHALVGQHLDAAVGHDVEGIGRLALVEHRLARLDLALAHALEQRLDVLGRQVAQQVAGRQQRQVLARGLPLAVQRILDETRGVAQRRALLLEEQRGDVVDHRAEREAAGDRRPGDMDVGAVPGEVVGAFEAELDRECGDQRAGGEGEDAGQHFLWERDIEAEGCAHVTELVVPRPSNAT